MTETPACAATSAITTRRGLTSSSSVLEPVEGCGAFDRVHADRPAQEPARDLRGEIAPIELGQRPLRAVRVAVPEHDCVGTAGVRTGPDGQDDGAGWTGSLADRRRRGGRRGRGRGPGRPANATS